MDKDYTTYSTEKLLEMWEKGAKWLIGKEHSYPGNKDRNGDDYDEELFMAGLKKIESIEDALRDRGKHGLLETRAAATFTTDLDAEKDDLLESLDKYLR